jgi:hypothetical protein
MVAKEEILVIESLHLQMLCVGRNFVKLIIEIILLARKMIWTGHVTGILQIIICTKFW